MPGEVRYAEIKKLLESGGYYLDRVTGSHHVFVKPGVGGLAVPVHRGKVKAIYWRQALKLVRSQEKPDGGKKEGGAPD